MIGFKNISTIFEFLWINTPVFNASSDADEKAVISIDEMTAETTLPSSSSSPSWKSMELARLADEEIAHYANQVQLILHDLNAIKIAIRNLIDSNAVELMDEQYPIQFFNLNASDQNDTLKEHIELERKSLEKVFADEKSRIENIKQIMWDCFETKPQKLQGIYTDIFIQNYPLTDLDEKLNDEAMLKKVLQNEELFRQICDLKPWIHPNISIRNEIEWPKERTQFKTTSERFSLFAAKIVDQQLTANVNLDYNFFATLSIESENIDISNDHLVNEHNIRMHVSFGLRIFGRLKLIPAILSLCLFQLHSTISFD